MVDDDWQMGKSLVECNREMLSKEIGCDVTFEVGPAGSLVKRLSAHKYMLVCRGKVFADMFKEDFADRGEMTCIRVNDVEAGAFQEMLSYIYTDEAVITAGLALPLIFAAKKYRLPGLVDKCNIFLRDNLVTENVCTILDQSLAFADLELKERCINHICVNADSIVKTNAFLDLSPTALEIVIGRDNFNLASNDECDIHNVCVAWAKSQLERRTEIESATHLQIRDHLGQVLYKIRYPVLSIEKFAQNFGCIDIITVSERDDVYYYIPTKTKRNTLAFNTEPRKIDCFVERYTAFAAGPCGKEETVDAISFTTDKNISLSAVGLYAGYRSFDYVTTINVQERDDIVSRTTTLVHSDGTSNQVKVALNRPITLRAGTVYTVWTPPSSQLYGACGNTGQQDYTVYGVKFTFSDSTNPISQTTTVATGQLPRFYFSCDPEPIPEFVIQRYLAVTTEPWDSSTSNGDAIRFTSNRDIYLVAVGLYAGLADAEYDITIKIQKQIDAQVLNESSVHVASSPGTQTVKVPLSQPVAIYAGLPYVIWTPPSTQQYGCYGNTGQMTVEAGDVTFTFEGSTDPASYTTLEQGQLPQLFFERRSLITTPENVVERYGRAEATQWDSTTSNDAISFTTSRNIIITAVGLSAAQGGMDYDVTINIQLNNDIVKTTVTKVIADGGRQKIRVALTQPYSVKAGVLVTLWTAPIACMYGYTGRAGKRTCVVNDVTFTFFNALQPASNTTVSNGQLPQIYFKEF